MILLFIVLTNGFSQTVEFSPWGYVVNPAAEINIKDNIIEFVKCDPINNGSGRYAYELIIKDNIPFLRIMQHNIFYDFIVLASKKLFVLFKENNVHPILIGYDTMKVIEVTGLYSQNSFAASSYLTERGKQYLPGNLSNLDLEFPWVNGNGGKGIGQQIIVNNINASALYFFSGYVSFRRPDLYLKNARPKKIRIFFEKSNVTLDVELQDTPSPQLIEFGNHYENQRMIITFLEAYAGTMYEDLCVNSLLFRVY